MKTTQRITLDDYLRLEYPFNVIAAPDTGGYVVTFPDLPGCATHVERIEDIGAVANEIRRLWIRTEYEDGANIPEPSYPEEYSGKFVVRLPRSLHRRLAESAEREGVSLNQYVVMLLSGGDAEQRVAQRIEAVSRQLAQAEAVVPSTMS